ncbi:MAG TPA: metallophosphoesterase, partial [Bryobacteraceae bacterium]|nr:metallophosphoesterase [Bryobacteraceae bacterium]
MSDLHFGKTDPELLAPLVRAVKNVSPTVVAVSGDFVQWSREEEFRQARDFIEQLPGRQILVPGNHDMAFLNPLRRATQRLRLFRRYITTDKEPFYLDEEIAILGVNTARVTHLRDGRIRGWQVDRIEERFRNLHPDVTRILVTHHPFDLPERYTRDELIGRRVIRRVVGAVDVLLAGHMHISYAGRTATRYKIEGQSAIFVQAGTALSTRVRGEVNSFNVLTVDEGKVDINQYAWSEETGEFAKFSHSVFFWEVGRGWTV